MTKAAPKNQNGQIEKHTKKRNRACFDFLALLSFNSAKVENIMESF